MLTTARCTLRRARQADLADIHAFMSDPIVMAYWSTPPHTSPARTQENLDRLIGASDPLTYFVIEHGNRAIGMAGLHEGTEIGFILHQNVWRQGFVTEVMERIIPYLWQVKDVPCLTADVDPRNAASIGVLRKLGFRETHRAKNTFCIDGVWADSIYFRLDRPSDRIQ